VAHYSCLLSKWQDLITQKHTGEKRYQKFFINHLCNLFTGTINFVNIEKNIYFFNRTFID